MFGAELLAQIASRSFNKTLSELVDMGMSIPKRLTMVPTLVLVHLRNGSEMQDRIERYSDVTLKESRATSHDMLLTSGQCGFWLTRAHTAIRLSTL